MQYIIQVRVRFKSLESALEFQTKCTSCAQWIQDGVFKYGQRSTLEMIDIIKDLNQVSTQVR